MTFEDDQIPEDEPADAADGDDSVHFDNIPLSDEERKKILDSAPTEPFEMDA